MFTIFDESPARWDIIWEKEYQFDFQRGFVKYVELRTGR